MIGIYKITNKVTNKIYVGSSINIENRWNQHKKYLSKGTHKLPKLQNSVNKHGFENFVFEVIEECKKELLIEREQYWIDTLDSYNKGYNSRPIANSNLGIKFSDEHKSKISNSHKGKIVSEESKKKMSSYWKKYYETHEPTNKGKTYKASEETKEKLSKAFKGKTYEEIYGLEKAKEIKEKRRISALGKKHNEETKKKLSEKAKKEWELGIHNNNKLKKKEGY